MTLSLRDTLQGSPESPHYATDNTTLSDDVPLLLCAPTARLLKTYTDARPPANQ